MTSTPKVYRYRLDDAHCHALEVLARDGKAAARKVRHARVPLLGDHARPGGKLADHRIAESTDMHLNTVARVRKAFAAGGLRPALERKPRETPPVPAKIDGVVEAHLIAICTGPPRSGSWLNVAEIELSVLARQCLARRLGSEAEVDGECAAWVRARNADGSRVTWRFTTADARVKLRHLYPQF